MELFLEFKHFRVTVHWNVLVNNTITNVLIARKTLRYCVSQTRTSRCWLIFFSTSRTATRCVHRWDRHKLCDSKKNAKQPRESISVLFQIAGVNPQPTLKVHLNSATGQHSNIFRDEPLAETQAELFTGCSKWLSSRSHLSPSFLLASDWLWLCCKDRLDVSRCEPLNPLFRPG